MCVVGGKERDSITPTLGLNRRQDERGEKAMSTTGFYFSPLSICPLFMILLLQQCLWSRLLKGTASQCAYELVFRVLKTEEGP